MYSDNAVYSLIICFTIIYKTLRNKRQITEKWSGYTNKIMYSIDTNVPKELKLASNSCYDNVSFPCDQIYTLYRISTKIHVILTKDNLKFTIYTQTFWNYMQ